MPAGARGLAATLAAAVAMLAGLLAGCGSRSGNAAAEEVRAELARKVPRGWQVSYARDVSFPLLAPAAQGDLVVWKTEPVKLRARGAATQPEAPATIYFTVSFREFIPLADYPARWKKNEEIRKEHERVLHKVAMVPRNEKGELMPRGTVESLDVQRFREEYAKLPPYDADMPSHYYENVALKVRDWRVVLLPEARQHQQEMNTVYVAVCTALKEYKR